MDAANEASRYQLEACREPAADVGDSGETTVSGLTGTCIPLSGQ